MHTLPIFSTRRACVGAVTALAAVLSVLGCGLFRIIAVGPIQVTLPISEGDFPQDLTNLRAIGITFDREICDLPSEEKIIKEIGSVGGLDLSQFIRLQRLGLVQSKIRARRGDFRWIRSLEVRFVPPPSTSEQPVILGVATSETGFGGEIDLVPETDVDLLELIRLNDENTNGDCSKLEFVVTPQGAPLSPVEYILEITIDGYGLVGVFDDLKRSSQTSD